MSCRNCDCARCREANTPAVAPLPFVQFVGVCTCGRPYWSIAPPVCPVHGVALPPITFTVTSLDSNAIEQIVGTTPRRGAS